MSLSIRAAKGLSIPQTSGGYNDTFAADPYHPQTNPNGFIKLSSADNLLTVDLLNDKFGPKAMEGFDFKSLLPVYPRPSGSPETLASVATFVNTFCAPGLKDPIKPSDLTLVSGVTASSDLIANAICDEGDIILTMAPFYYRFTNDYGDRSLAKVKLIDAFISAEKPFEVSVDKFEAKFAEMTQKGLPVKAILIVNPRNPDGGVATLAELKPIIDWAIKKRNLFVILDEIYNLLVYDPNVKFESALKLFDDDPSLDRQRLIWLWGLSKVFSVPGLRVATIYTSNKSIQASLKRSLMYQVPNVVTQHLVKGLLNDHNWVSSFIESNNANLLEARDYFASRLKSLSTSDKQIRIANSSAGFFFLADFSDFLAEKTWSSEGALRDAFIREKVLIISGADVRMPFPGWFRIVFSANTKAEVDEAVIRISRALNN
uniref:Aminotran_1_2 domain-containing protein n=1 Tax=Panagrellus redivivus TaxID=6233 RepID=A0A7E4VZA2_PANRE